MSTALVLSDASWLSQAELLTQVGVTDATSANAAGVNRARLAAAALVERLRPDLRTLTTDAQGNNTVGYAATAEVVEAGLLLGARLYARRTSPAGLASYGEFGPAAVMRHDPDVAQLLRVGRHAPVRIG